MKYRIRKEYGSKSGSLAEYQQINVGENFIRGALAPPAPLVPPLYHVKVESRHNIHIFISVMLLRN